MSNSDDNTNELESYGVWVKNTVNDEPSQVDQTNKIDADDETIDLPDFDDTDFSDMFKDDSQFSTEDQVDDFGIDTDTTLSTDELAKITDLGDVAIENVDAPEIVDDEITEDNSEPIFDSEVSNEELPNFDDIPEVPKEETAFNVDDILDAPIEEITTDEINEGPISDDDNGEEEISLDDFLEDGFSDESVASGNNGYEAGAEPKTEDVSNEFGEEEISLDDFLDDTSFDEAPVEKKETEDEEEPLDMDITFDDSVDNIATEDNFSLDNDSIEDYDDGSDDNDDFEGEEVSLDDFGVTNDVTPEPIDEKFVADASSDNIATEEVDLSDFGIDADADETPIVQDVETQKNKEKVVDYDLFIGNESTSSAPVVNEIKNEENNNNVEVEPVEPETVQNNTTAVDNSLLQQIVADLSSLKDEIKNIKSDIEDIKAKEAANEAKVSTPLPVTEESFEDNVVTEEEPVIEEDEVTIEEPVVDIPVTNEEDNSIDIDNIADDIPVSEDLDLPEMDNEGGFFNSDDTDETIALSGDELSNIMNNAEFSENAVSEEDTENEVEEEPDVISEEVFDNTLDETAIEDESELTLDNIDTDNFEEPVEEVNEENNDVAIDELEDNGLKDDDTGLNFNYEDEKLEEPTFDDFEIETAEEEVSEELPDEISIPKDEDIFVESTANDFMDSVKDSTEDQPAIVEPITEIEEIDNSLEPIEEIEEDNPAPVEAENEEEEGFTTIDDVINNPPVEEVELDEVPTVEKLLESEVIDDDEDDAFTDVSDFGSVDEDKTEEVAENNEDDVFTDVTDFAEPETDVISEESGFADVSDFEEPAAIETEPVIEEENFADVTEIPEEDNTIVEESEEPVIEETSIPAEENDNEVTFDEIDNLNNDLSSSNLDYLTTKEETENDSPAINSDLKQEIKSVLLYMDQLLENLPEEKIYEFAKSEEFATYKKLFKDLGLS